jgi:small conductance mechanosensitive channel
VTTSTSRTLRDWFDEHGPVLAAGVGRVLLVVLLALLVRAALHRLVDRMIRTALHGGRLLKDRTRGTAFDPSPLLSERRRQRTETLGHVLRSLASFAVAAVAGSMVLAELGLDLTPLIASAGIVGVALGFGAQNLVRDVLSGMFMLLEDQYGVGDVIDVGPAVGSVEAVTLRTTRLRDLDGTVWHVRNGEIARVGNRSQGWSRVLLDMPVATDTDLAAARAVVLAVAEDLATDELWADRVLGEPEVWGLERAQADGLVLRVAMTTAPAERSSVERELRERLVTAFAQRGIALGA